MHFAEGERGSGEGALNSKYLSFIESIFLGVGVGVTEGGRGIKVKITTDVLACFAGTNEETDEMAKLSFSFAPFFLGLIFSMYCNS